ncbi:MAG: phosphatase PAP2 family protein [Lautropia sp.]
MRTDELGQIHRDAPCRRDPRDGTHLRTPGARCTRHARTRFAVALTAASFAIAPYQAAFGFDPDLFAGDVGQVLIPAFALGLTYHFDDTQGRVQWAKTVGTTVLATEALKRAFAGTSLGMRPNGGVRSFPSGHTSAACSGAFFMARRYGWQFGAPWLAYAAFTAYSRVDEDMHHARDVVAGCALAYGISRWFVDEKPPTVDFSLDIRPGYRGVAFAYHF